MTPTTESASSDREFAAFYREAVTPLVAFLVVQGATLADAAEIAQDSMAKAYRDWARLEQPRAWVHRVAARALVRLLADKRERLVDQVPELTQLVRATDIERWEQRHDIVSGLAQLPPRQRQIMAWTLSDYRPAEIAAELGLESAVVRQSLFVARKTLAAQLARWAHGQ